MRAIRYNAKNRTLTLVDVKIPSLLSPDHVIIKVSYAGICSNDVAVIQGSFPSYIEEVTMGHEISGAIVEYGENVKKFTKGQHVVVSALPYCQDCEFCSRGRPNLCENGACKGVVGAALDGGFADYVVLHSALVYALPEKLPLAKATICMHMTCIQQSLSHIGAIPSYFRVLIQGAGMDGLLFASNLHYKGIRDLTLSEPVDARRGYAKGLGWGFKVLTPEELNAQGPSVGYDLIIDVSGNTEAIEYAFQHVRPGGTIFLYGGCPEGSKVSFDPAQAVQKEIRILSNVGHGFHELDCIASVNNMADDYLDFNRMGVRYYCMDEYEMAFKDLESKVISKAIFKVDKDI